MRPPRGGCTHARKVSAGLEALEEVGLPVHWQLPIGNDKTLPETQVLVHGQFSRMFMTSSWFRVWDVRTQISVRL